MVGPETPSEHIYQTDRLADHRALAALLGRSVTRLYPGHSGPLDAGEVRTWLDGAAADTGDNAVSIRPRCAASYRAKAGLGDIGATAGMRARLIWRRGPGVGYALGADLRAGYLDGGIDEADAHPVGLALRGADGGAVVVTGGIGIGGVRGNTASHAG